VRWGHDFGSLWGVLVAVLCGLAVVAYGSSVVWASLRQARATRTFGEPKLLADLVSFDATGRRAVKAVLLVVAMLFAFVALARPKFGSGTKIVPATNLDVVIVLDYSKSMCPRHRAQPHREGQGGGGAADPGPAGRAVRCRGVRGGAHELPTHE
jgi:hypothetical protein